jgi:beta-glucanase (GH16 family)
MLYGKFSIRMKGPVIPGVVTTFITLSRRGDEIDW